MKELSRKVFWTVFCILTFFLLFNFVIINVQNYKREYENVSRNLNMMNDREKPFLRDRFRPEEPEKFNVENMMIMDHEVYTVEIVDDVISKIISHGNESEDFDVYKAAKHIMDSNNENISKIGNLFTSEYCYAYTANEKIIIINLVEIRDKVRIFLAETLLAVLLLILLIYFVSKKITGWITKPAKEAFDKQREFIADASHELKTPLAVIMASADELNVDGDDGRYMDNIKFESERMSKLIAGLLDLSKIEEGVSQKSFKTENISKIVEKLSLVFEGIAFEQGVLIDTDITDDISMECSKEEIEKLVSTLIDNAIKHSYKDTSIHISLKKIKNSIVLEVVNQGDPIKTGDEEKIFERFYRADQSRSRSDNRYGLGLAIAKGIVINHKGTIKAFSEDNKTFFKVTF